MAAKAITIEIGYSLTKICEVDYKAKTHKIYKSFTVSNGAEVINDGALTASGVCGGFAARACDEPCEDQTGGVYDHLLEDCQP